jgi:hypothetical protein
MLALALDGSDSGNSVLAKLATSPRANGWWFCSSLSEENDDERHWFLALARHVRLYTRNTVLSNTCIVPSRSIRKTAEVHQPEHKAGHSGKHNM